VVRVIAVGAVLASLAGCGGSGGGSPTGAAGTGGAPTGGVLTWKDGGASRSAIYPAGTRTKTALTDMIQVAGGDGSGMGLSFAVTLRPPPLVAGTYTCAQTGQGGVIVSLSYAKGTTPIGTMADCSITITALSEATGEHLVGTFSATLSGGGASAALTDGKFDVASTVTSL
jgi:hypothetical protein